MAGNMNIALISGRLGRDPQIRNSGAGKPIANFSVASGEWWTKDGEKKERTEWFNVVCFNEVTSKYLEHNVKKGDYVRVMGRIRTRKWQDDNGQEKYSTEIVVEQFFGEIEKIGGQSTRGAQSEDDYGTTKTRESLGATGTGGAPAMDDDIPFAPEWR